jgi:hypothetical protein
MWFAALYDGCYICVQENVNTDSNCMRNGYIKLLFVISSDLLTLN